METIIELRLEVAWSMAAYGLEQEGARLDRLATENNFSYCPEYY